MENKVIVTLVLILTIVLITNFLLMFANEKANFFLGNDGITYLKSIETNTYQPLTIFILNLFVNQIHPEVFYFLHAFLLFLLIPILFYTLTKHWLAIPIYFSTYFVWSSDNLGTFAQTIIIIILLIMMQRKNNLQKIGLIILSLGIHSVGFVLLLAWFFIENLLEKEKLYCIPPTIFSIKNFIPNYPNENQLGSNIKIFDTNLLNSYLTLPHIINLFTRVFLLPLWLFSIKELLKKENWKHFYFLITILIAGFFIDKLNPLRILSLVFIPLGFGLIQAYKTMPTTNKNLVQIFLAIGIILNFYTWLTVKNFNYCILP